MISRALVLAGTIAVAGLFGIAAKFDLLGGHEPRKESARLDQRLHDAGWRPSGRVVLNLAGDQYFRLFRVPGCGAPLKLAWLPSSEDDLALLKTAVGPGDRTYYIFAGKVRDDAPTPWSVLAARLARAVNVIGTPSDAGEGSLMLVAPSDCPARTAFETAGLAR